MHSLLSLKIPSLGLKISRLGFLDPGIVVTKAREPTIYPQPGGAQDLGRVKITLNNYRTSSKSQGQQKSWKAVPRPPKIIGNGPWNHENSNICEKGCLQYISYQIIGFPTPDIQIQTQKSSEKKPGNKHDKVHLFWSELPEKLSNR